MPNKRVTVKNSRFESGKTNIAVPVTGVTPDEILNQLRRALAVEPDVIEWRIDFFKQVLNQAVYMDLAKTINRLIGDTVLLTTFRTTHEGGASNLVDTDYYATCRWILENRLTDMIDIEFNRDKKTVADLIKLAHYQHIPVILSNHDFQATPDQQTLISRFQQMAARNADIAKIAVMPQNSQDVLTLLTATTIANQKLTIPLISMSMGELGKISRITGPQFGSTLSFATVGQASAPGQLSVEDVRKSFKILN